MGTTPFASLPYPEANDTPYVHLDIKALAESVDENVVVVSTTAPPHKAGRHWYNPTTKREYVSNGAAYVPTFAVVVEGSFSGTTLPSGGGTLGAATMDTFVAVPYARRLTFDWGALATSLSSGTVDLMLRRTDTTELGRIRFSTVNQSASRTADVVLPANTEATYQLVATGSTAATITGDGRYAYFRARVEAAV